MLISEKLLHWVHETRPDLYAAILRTITPYSLKSVLKIFDCHLRQLQSTLQKTDPDVDVLRIFNDNLHLVPEFVWTVIKHMHFPTPGDAIGIFIISRLTKSDTQCALDSKHIPAITTTTPILEFNVEKDILDELSLFSSHGQIFELANRHKVATVFMGSGDDTTIAYLQTRLPGAGVLERGFDFNKGRNAQGQFQYLVCFRYILVEDRGSIKVLYKSLNDLYGLLRRVPLRHVAAFSDIRCLFRKCGVASAFFNMVQVAERQLFVNDGSCISHYEKDVVSILRFMFSRGELLPMNREGLARNKDKTGIDVISFEAFKRNCCRHATDAEKNQWQKVQTSSEHIFYGMQFNEGTGYSFGLLGQDIDDTNSGLEGSEQSWPDG